MEIVAVKKEVLDEFQETLIRLVKAHDLTSILLDDLIVIASKDPQILAELKQEGIIRTMDEVQE